jgi:hypothetical protein
MRSIADGSSTGYFIQKLIPHQCNEGDKWYDYDHAFQSYLPYMRLADIYLMYAEARAAMANSVSDLSNKDYCMTLSAIDAINALRDRVNSDDYPMEHVVANVRDTREHFIDEVRRERAVELSFEGFRWCDLQRWLLLTEPPYTMKYSHEFDFRYIDEKKPLNIVSKKYIQLIVSLREFFFVCFYQMLVIQIQLLNKTQSTSPNI